MDIPPITALLPMKAHSERVANKNIHPFCGRPLFHWVMDELSRSEHITRIVIDTDSEEIARSATDYFDATILMRPERLQGDLVGITPLIDFEISQVEGDVFLQTHATNPLLTAETIEAAIAAFAEAPDHDSLFAVTSVRKRFFWSSGAPVNHDPANLLRTQDLEPILEENSNMYIFTRDSFLRHRHRIGATPIMFPMDPLEAVDIDDESDFTLAEALMQARKAQAQTR
jgi:CMP-N-acetylneuraminic acid synthetase